MDEPDVIVVGGRPAGASLAARLGAAGVRVLVLDKATFPSAPAVPSCPLLYPQAMALLDELGVPESAYAAATVRVDRFVFEFGEWWHAVVPMVESHGRAWVHGLDRVAFDHVLWAHLDRFPTVERRAGSTVTGLLRDGAGRVVGVEGRADGAPFAARARHGVVGADGRFSGVARRAGAAVVEDRPDHASTVFWADWEGLAPFGDEDAPVVHVHTTGRGVDVLFFPLPGGRVSVCTHERADRVHTGGDALAHYLGVVEGLPPVARRLRGARRVTEVLGMKNVGNRYLAPGGPGWALVGDALHHKDPVDGQGIYDALLGARLLAEALGPVLDGRASWEDAVASYGAAVVAATRPMFLATTDRLREELYGEPPVAVIRTLIRWCLTDPEYQERFVRYLCRDLDPATWRPPGLLLRASLRGAWRDLTGGGAG